MSDLKKSSEADFNRVIGDLSSASYWTICFDTKKKLPDKYR